MNLKIKSLLYFFATGIFLLVMVSNINLSNQNKRSPLNNLSLIAHADNAITEWWESKTHVCVSNVPCNQQAILVFKVNGIWQEGSGGFGYEYQFVMISGTKTECTTGNQVAHCWECTGTDCVVPPDILIRVLESLNRG